ncbi:hypothetical protein SADUNF_Sadunf05G0004600 [Salix dunnii]|uniref:Disease resistance RPP13-like protein 1 n=1 Tax=Salix dunnii TaxID=1413687 RepID=A0A835K3Q7_9ROSI|nr:hypothetical protein SADUNF_Sadunf05G0004600 [Salix dunnii]
MASATALAIGGSFLSAFLQVLFDRMASREVLGFFKDRKLNDRLLRKLKVLMIAVNGVLDDAEEKQIAKPAVEMWVNELKDAVYEADDLLDEISYEALRPEVEGGSQSSADQVRGFLSTFSFQRVKEEMETKLEQIVDMLEYLVQQKNALGLREGAVEKASSQRIPTTSLVDESGVYGRDGDKEAIMKLVRSANENGKRLDVIPIVGMAGVGKTTLAQLVYNDSRVGEQFDMKVWICVSEEFDVLKVIKDILKKVGSMNCDTMTGDQLHCELEKESTGKKIMLVLDDVWSNDWGKWDFLLTPFKSLAHGSKILVTTRIESVASVRATVSAHRLQELNADDCWLVFAKHAFDDGSCSERPDLEEIGKEVVRKCKGLPLAAKALGGLLRFKRDAKEWEKILRSNVWDLPNDGILPVLRLSYYYLPPQLKQCFAYCAIFPENHEFNKDELVRLWMAEGFLVPPNGNKEMVEVGNEFFQELVSRSFFQQSNGKSRPVFQGSNGDPLFVMHDLINDLARYVSREFCFRLEGEDSNKISERTRHLSYAVTRNDACERFEGIYDAKLLRTFLPLSEAWLRKQINILPVSRVWPRNEIDNKVTHDLLPRLTRLRVLSLFNYSNVAELPDSMGKLKHLRYLNLSATSIKRLPEVVSTAYHLQTLILENCKELVDLPDSVGHLKHLLYASLKGSKIKILPESMSTLYNLQTLVLEDCRHLVRLPHSIGNLKRLRYVTLKGTAIKKLPASMGGLCNLQTLILRSCKDLIELPHDMGRLINLSHLDIEGTKLSKMPQRMGKLTKLQNLSDFFLGKDTGSSIQELGKLQHLQGGLNIWNLQNVGSAPDALQDNVKGMKHLKTLNLMWDGDPNDSGHARHVLDKLEPDVNMEYLYIYGYGGTRFSDWVGDSSFSRIVSMELSRCKYCTSLPPLGQLGSLKELIVRGFEGLAVVGREFYGSCTSVRKPFASLESLTLSMMPEWREWISDQGMQAFPCLLKLCISGCPYLRKVLSNHCLPSLTTLEIEGCRQLVTSFPRCPIIDEIKLDDGFRHLLLRRLPSGMHSLEVDRCNSTDSIPKEMEQIGCFLTTLEEIEMENCDSLKCFQLELFPRLKILRISKCSNLEFICEHEGPLEDLTSLHSLKIWECPELVSFPKGGFPASCLTELQLFDCANLKSLPEHMNSLLPSLEDLRLFLLPKLEVFPEGGLPSKLKSLYIEDCCKLIAARMQWSLQSLPSLSKFTVGVDENVESFPEEMLLPSTLASLEIWSLKTLKSLNYSGLQHLTSLEQLTITDCPNLQSMPGEGLPSSLSSIEIWRCPLLDQRCQQGRGEDWLKITRIPNLHINGYKIHQP